MTPYTALQIIFAKCQMLRFWEKKHVHALKGTQLHRSQLFGLWENGAFCYGLCPLGKGGGSSPVHKLYTNWTFYAKGDWFYHWLWCPHTHTHIIWRTILMFLQRRHNPGRRQMSYYCTRHLTKPLTPLLSPGCTSIKDTNWTKQGRVQEVGSEICLHDQWQTRANSLC